MGAAAYELIQYRTETGRRSVRLQDPAEITINGIPFLAGEEVDREGVPAEPTAAYLREHQAVTGKRRHIIEVALITRRSPLEMDLTLGELVTAGTARSTTDA